MYIYLCSIIYLKKNQFDLGTGANAGLERSDESMFGKYSLEMRALKSAYATFDATYNKKASYIFIVPSFTGGGLSGFMVRGRSVGFVATGADMRTYAHELGHGVFGLEHTFPEIPQTPNIDNLMAYGTGTHLTHEQWKIMHARKPAYSWFDTEEDGSLKNKMYPKDIFYNLTTTQGKVGDAYQEKTISAKITIKIVNLASKSFFNTGLKTTLDTPDEQYQGGISLPHTFNGQGEHTFSDGQGGNKTIKYNLDLEVRYNIVSSLNSLQATDDVVLIVNKIPHDNNLSGDIWGICDKDTGIMAVEANIDNNLFIRIILHELGHRLGLQDLYDIKTGSAANCMGKLMCSDTGNLVDAKEKGKIGAEMGGKGINTLDGYGVESKDYPRKHAKTRASETIQRLKLEY